MKEVVVYIFINDAFVPAGRLAFDAKPRGSRSFFRYGDQYLKRKDAISVDPVQLPLLPKEFITEQGFEIFNGIRDAGPDRFGRYILDKKFAYPLDELDYITATGPDRAGALAFSDNIYGIEQTVHTRLDLKLCVDAAEELISGENTPELQAFLNDGSSLGGARPKATVTWDNKPFVAKFTVSMDKRNEALIEYATMSLAKQCGLNVPIIDKANVSGRDVFLIERFDRHHDKPIPFISGLTITGLHEQDFAQWSYAALCHAINKFCKNPRADKLELFKRMVFNILVFNSDDHMRNHGFIYQGSQKWALSPLYDVVPSFINTQTYMLSMYIGDYGKEASLENAYTAAKYFDIELDEAHHIVDTFITHLKDWPSHYRACGVSEQEIEKLQHSFHHLAMY